MLKDPDATLDYRVDWALWLAGDTISTSTWIVPTGLVKVTDTHDSTSATVWLSGGTNGKTYEVTNRIVTADGRTDDRTLPIIVRDR
jgi:hypothetical protein